MNFTSLARVGDPRYLDWLGTVQRVVALSAPSRNGWRVLMRVCSLQKRGFMLAVTLAVTLAAALPLVAKPWPWPLPNGELSGEIAPVNASDGTKLAWRIVVERAAGARQSGTLIAEGPGAQLHVDWVVDAAAAEPVFHWTIRHAELDLGRWWSVVQKYLTDEYSDAVATGELGVRGEGTWRQGEWSGHATARLANGRLDFPSGKLLLEGVASEVNFEDLAGLRTTPKQVVTIERGRYDFLALGAGRVEFGMAGEIVHVGEASLEVLGGTIAAEPFEVSRADGGFTVTARAEGLNLAELQPLMPSVVTEARGRVDGVLTLTRDAGGMRIGGGRLVLAPGQTALLRLVTNSDVLLRSVPAQVLKVAPGIAEIETGKTPLLAHRLDVRFTPAGDEMGRTAVVRVEGEPADQNVAVPLVVDVNVRGPLEELVKFGTDSRLRFGGQP